MNAVEWGWQVSAFFAEMWTDGIVGKILAIALVVNAVLVAGAICAGVAIVIRACRRGGGK